MQNIAFYAVRLSTPVLPLWNKRGNMRQPGHRLLFFWMVAASFLGAVSTAQQAHTNQADTVTNPFAGNPAEISAGKVLYDQTCQACHGGDARGDRGPALSTGNFSHGGSDTDIFQTIRTGVPGTQMPSFATLPTDTIWRIITYLRSLNANASLANEVVPGDPAAGKQIFFGKGGCSQCHEVNATGGIVGPDLSAIGTNTVQHLRSVILKPNDPASRAPRAPAPETLIVKTQSGKTYRGVRVADDGFTLILRDVSGETHVLDTHTLLDRQSEPKSIMPDTYAQTLAPEEITNLAAYLKTLKERDLSETIHASLPDGLSYERLLNSSKEPQNWLTYWGGYDSDHFSPLKQVTPANVGRLQARWSVQMPGPALLETTPLVVDGVMYTSGQPGQVMAIDARTGLQRWTFERRQKVKNPYETNSFNRGVAVLGDRVFVGTLDAALVALDARTGRELWETQVADTMAGYTIVSAPLALKNMVVIGVTGGEFGIRGFLDAYDAATGKRLWRFDTIPGPGEFGHDTWLGDSWKHGSGATWLTGSYDPELDTLYWTVGNPGPGLNADVRNGDNLFTCSVLALDPATGKRKWHYQFTPGDSHDWDANEDVVLTDLTVNGVRHKALLQADRNGMFYALDRTNGKLLLAKPFVRQTWNRGFDANGRPILVDGWRSSTAGSTVYPALGGGTNWQSPSYDSSRSMLYLVANDSSMTYRSIEPKYEKGRLYLAGAASAAGGGTPGNDVIALDVRDGSTKWKFPLVRHSLTAGLMATAGGVVFVSGAEGDLIALNSDTGKLLWRYKTGGIIATSPIGFAVDGEQYVAIAAGNTLYTFALPEVSPAH